MYDSLYWFWWSRILHLQASCSEVVVHILCSDGNWCQWLDPQSPGCHWHLPSHSDHHWETSAGNHCENFYNFWSLGLYFAPLNSALSQIASYICRHWGSYHACTVFWLKIKKLSSPLWLTPRYYSLLFCVQKNKNRPDWDRIYEKSKALSRTGNPVKTPLLALPYGKPPLPSECSVIINMQGSPQHIHKACWPNKPSIQI